MSEAFGTWQLETLVAVGGLGEVWRATRGETIVAMKRLHTHLARNDEAREQFSVEQKLATSLPRHPNLIHAIESGDVDGRPYVALDLVDGGDLRKAIAPPAARTDLNPAKVVLPSSRAIASVLAGCDAAAHLHHEGWIHGDINPGNLIVETGTDRTVLIDLGVARAIGQAGAVRGTHAYMAPEQVRGEAWTRATDVFALGVVLWELVAAARLFHRGPPWLSMAAVVEASVPALPASELDAIAQAALVKDPTQRIQTAAELAERLRALAEN